MTIDERIRTHIVDAIAGNERMLEAVEVQRTSENVRQHPDAHDLVIRLERMLRDRSTALASAQSALDADQDAAVTSAVKGAIMALAGLFERLRGQPLSEMMRRNYTALSHDVISTEVLHTLALAGGRENVARDAMAHARNVTALLSEMRRLMPYVVVWEGSDGDGIQLSPAQLEEAREAWRLDTAGEGRWVPQSGAEIPRTGGRGT